MTENRLNSDIKIGIYFSMRFGDIFLAVVIILSFAILFAISYLITSYQNIVDNWPEYACSPEIMPFASYFGHDTAENFNQCISNMQSGVMGVFTTPIDYVGGTLLTSVSNLSENVASLRNLQGYMRNNMGDFSVDAFGIIQGVLIGFQKIMLPLKDLTMKLLGVVSALLYIISGSMDTGKSILDGPIMTIIDIVTFGICFRGDTPVQLRSGHMVSMSDIQLGDILVNGSEVKGTLQLKGGPNNPYYKIHSKRLQRDIYVTGDHKIQNSLNRRFMPVKHHRNAIKTDNYDDILYCLITDDHLIPVGEYIFWDWED